jgi:excinuclease ABC subunit A
VTCEVLAMTVEDACEFFAAVPSINTKLQTTGLYFHYVDQLLKVLHSLRDGGNTVVVIEHNLEVIKTADWVVDLGPEEGGSRGGNIIAVGTSEEVAEAEGSFTGQFLKRML